MKLIHIYYFFIFVQSRRGTAIFYIIESGTFEQIELWWPENLADTCARHTGQLFLPY